MATYFSINDGNFDSGSVFTTTIGGVSAGTVGSWVGTTYSYAAPVATSDGSTYTGVALHLSARSATPTGTIDITLSANTGSITTGTLSYPVSGITSYYSSNNVVPNYPVGWIFFQFPTPITVPSTRTMTVGVKTSTSNQVSLIGTALTNLNRFYVTTTYGTPGSVDGVHVTGSLTTSGLSTKSVNYNSAYTLLTNLYIHNGGILNFDPTLNTGLEVQGAQGIQVTPGGTVNIGTSSNPIQSDKKCDIFLTQTSYINVHNGATFNAYGAYKTPYANVISNVNAGATIMPTSTDVSGWVFGDEVVVTPNDTSRDTFEIGNGFSSKSSGVINLIYGTAYSHISSDIIPGIINVARNISIKGNNSGVTAYGYVRFLDGSSSNINNVEFKSLKNATYRGAHFLTNSTGYLSLSNCVFNGDYVTTAPAISLSATVNPLANVYIDNCTFFKYGSGAVLSNTIQLSGLSANNFNFTNNIVLSSAQNGMIIDRLSSTYINIKNNFLIGNRLNGLQVNNPYVLSGAIGGIGCMNTICGSVVSGVNSIGNYDGLAGLYNQTEGINISGLIPRLSTTTFRNLTANNNKTSGFLLSGNSNNLLSPVKLNINGLIANDNKNGGFEGYSITGNLTSFKLSDNKTSNIITSIGTGDIIFDGLSSENTNSYYTKSFTSNSVDFNGSDPFGNNIDGCVNFNGTTHVLSSNDNNLSFSDDFTIEGWIYPISITLDTRARRIFSCGANQDNGLQLILGTADTTAAGKLTVFTSTGLISGSTTINTSTWYHFAISRKNSQMRLFVDGVQNGATVTNITNFDAAFTSPFVIGRYAGAVNGRYSGFISNLRILNNTCLYTSNFTVPTSPLSIITNTTLLLNNTGYINTTYITMPTTNIHVLSGTNYGLTLFKNSTLKGNSAYALKLNNTTFEQFSMDSCVLSSNIEDIGSTSSVLYLKGSYQFNNCTFGTGILSSTIQNYQPEVFLENGFVVMKENGVANKHYRLLQAGKISLDTTLAYGTNTVSEKLEPTSTTTKLRCGSKMVPVNKDSSYTVGCYVRKSSGYTGDAPRLILKRNSALGYDDTVLATSVSANGNWELLSGVVPASLDKGIFEVYVDCSGATGSGSINIDNWSLT